MVEPNKAGFEASLRQQLANLLNTPDTQIQNLRTWPGSIEVILHITHSEILCLIVGEMT